MSRPIAALLLLLLARPDVLVGQAAPSATQLGPGARVRIATRDDSKPRVTTVVARKGDTLLVRSREYNTIPLPFDDISRLEVSTGRHRNVVKGMAFGTLIGGTAGAILGAAAYEPCTGVCIMAPGSRGESAAFGGAVFGVLGFVVGTLTGLSSHDTWQHVPLDARRVSVNVRPRAHGTGLGVALEF